MRILMLLLLVVSFSALAGRADWTSISCDEMPVQITHPDFPADGFKCYSGESVPASSYRFHYLKQQKGGKFIQLNQVEANGTYREFAIGDRQTLKLLRNINNWARDNGEKWTDLKQLSGGQYSLLLGRAQSENVASKWSCFVHHSLAVPKSNGFRFRRYVMYCEENIRTYLSEKSVSSVLSAVSWTR